MRQKVVGDPGEPPAGVVVVERDRLVGPVTAGEDEGTAELGAEEMVERRVREHAPRATGRPGRPRARSSAPGSRRSEDDRRLRRAEQRQFLVGADRDRFGRRRHHGERLLVALLARAQARHRGLVGGEAGEVVAADPLDREHRSVAQQRHRLGERHREPRPAGGAAGRLGVEAAVARIVVLGAAVGAHREARHRRVRAVVRDGADDREARAAVRAVDERVAEAAVARVEQLSQAVVAGRDVGRNEGRLPAPFGSRRSRIPSRP